MGHEPDNQSHGGMVTLYTPLNYSYARIIRQAIVDLCVHAGMSEFKTAQFEMAVDEASSLIFSAQERSAPEIRDAALPGELSVRLYQDGDQVVVELCHGGEPLEMGESASPENWFGEDDLEATGLFVIRRFVDGLSYQRGTPLGHCLRMSKKK